MLRAIPFNCYAILSVLMVALIGSGIIKDYGPMAKAEKRAMEEGKLLLTLVLSGNATRSASFNGSGTVELRF